MALLAKRSEMQVKTQIVNVTSEQRDKTVWPNSFDYVFDLADPMYGVHSIELVTAEIPNSDYLIHENNNLIDYTFDGVNIITVTIPIGNYTVDTLEQELNTQFGGDFTITFDDATQKFTFVNTAAFQLLLESGPSVLRTIGNVLGFREPVDTVTSTSITAPFNVSLSGDTGVLVDVGDTTTNFLLTMDFDNPKYFTRIPLKVAPGNWNYWTHKTETDTKYEFTTRIHPIIDRLRISFWKEGYQKRVPYDFRGEENILTFRIKGFFNKSYADAIDAEFDQPSYEQSMLKGLNDQAVLLGDIKEELVKQSEKDLLSVTNDISNTITSTFKKITGTNDTEEKDLVELHDEFFEKVSEPDMSEPETEPEKEPVKPIVKKSVDLDQYRIDLDPEPEYVIDPDDVSVESDRPEYIPRTEEEERDKSAWDTAPIKFGIALAVTIGVLFIIIKVIKK